MNPKYTLGLMLAGILTLGVGDVAGVVVLECFGVIRALGVPQAMTCASASG